MNVRLSNMAILAGLVATPVGHAHAQSNPWYVPPQAPAQMQPGSPVPQGAPQLVPQVVPQLYIQTPQHGPAAGYAAPQQQAPTTIVGPQAVTPNPYAPPGYGYAQPPATTGTVGSVALIAVSPAYAATPQGGTIAYQAAPVAPAAQYAAQTPPAPQQPAHVYVVPQSQTSAPQAYPYQPQVQVLGNYPPLGSDPTVTAGQSARLSTQPQPAAPAPVPATPTWGPLGGSLGPLQYPGFAGPSTLAPLSPGFGAYPGLSPAYPAPYGAAPYLGLPFY